MYLSLPAGPYPQSQLKIREIETNNNEEGEEHNVDYHDYHGADYHEHGVDYQDDNDDIEPVCSSDRHGSVGLAIDTTA